MSNKNGNKQDVDEYWEVEHILCERPTLIPEEKRGDVQYLIKHLNFEFDDCYWVHEGSIRPHAPDTLFGDWNQLSDEEKKRRCKYYKL